MEEKIQSIEPLLLVKGDVSGIQEFIFNVKSKGAARSLKSKSFFIKAISLLSANYLFKEFGVAEKDQDEYTISISGGNFFILLPYKKNKDELFSKYKKANVESLSKIGLNIVLTSTKFNINESYGSHLSELNKRNATEKLKLFNDSEYKDIFSPFQNEKENFDFSILSLKNRPSFSIEQISDISLSITEESINFLGFKLSLLNSHSGKYKLTNTLDTFFPHEKNNQPITFEDLAGGFGKTAKLGILKMDVDNLGTYFQDVLSYQEHKKLSELFRIFFEDILLKLIKGKYSDSVYNIISGGDDCFFVGNWKMIIDLAIEINKEFDIYWKNNHFSFSCRKDPTISAGIVIVNAKFPVVRFAELAEEALLQAKLKDASVKNAMCLFNIVIRWSDWNEIKGIKAELEKFVPNNARSLLMNARNAVLNKKDIEKTELSDYWELAYYLREVRNQGKQEDLNKILDAFEIQLNKSIDSGDVRYRYFFPIAARLLELESRQ